MTREEANSRFKDVIDKIASGYTSADVLLIDKIFDDIESRMCENCAYYENYFCQNEDVNYMFSDRWGMDARFGCNSYKPNLSQPNSY